MRCREAGSPSYVFVPHMLDWNKAMYRARRRRKRSHSRTLFPHPKWGAAHSRRPAFLFLPGALGNWWAWKGDFDWGDGNGTIAKNWDCSFEERFALGTNRKEGTADWKELQYVSNSSDVVSPIDTYNPFQTCLISLYSQATMLHARSKSGHIRVELTRGCMSKVGGMERSWDSGT